MVPYPRGVELTSERGSSCHSRKARLFEWIDLSVAIEPIYVNRTNVIHKRLKFLHLRWFPRDCVVESWIGVWVGRVSIPASGI